MSFAVGAQREYGSVARLFHWVTAVLVALQVGAGVAMTTEAIAALNDALFIFHKGMGCIFVPLMGLRLAWKLSHPVAALPAGAPATQRRLATLTHNALYALLFILPVSGYVRTVGDGYPIEMLDALGVPPLVSGIPDIAHMMMVIHAAAAYLLVALIAAHRLAGGAACAVEAGTAVTLDAVDANGGHLGGLILAGPRIIAAALDRQTSGIGETRGQARPGQGAAVLGTSTDEAVAKGAMLGLAGALDRALSAVAGELRERPPVYLTGGDAGKLSPWLATRCEHRPHLVLEGLGSIAGALNLRPARSAQRSG